MSTDKVITIININASERTPLRTLRFLSMHHNTNKMFKNKSTNYNSLFPKEIIIVALITFKVCQTNAKNGVFNFMQAEDDVFFNFLNAEVIYIY